MINPAWTFDIDKVQDWAFIDQALTPSECQQIIDFNSDIIENAKIIKNNSSIEDNDIRNSSIKFLTPDEKNKWLYQRVTDCISEVNFLCFNFDLFGLVESLQLTKYQSPHGHYNFHIDKSVGNTIRKLSFSILLDDENNYQGGDFEIMIDKETIKLPKKQGTMLIFPSYVLHRVTPVTVGTRHSLVGWVSGKPFK
jgi:PKHD-type hydroxylase